MGWATTTRGVALGVGILVWFMPQKLRYRIPAPVLEEGPPPLVCRSAFSPGECEAIALSFFAQPVETDMRASDGVRRTNRWDTHKRMLHAGELDWISARIVACAGLRDAAGLEPGYTRWTHCPHCMLPRGCT